jgi:ankyrin repeat protein
VVQLLLDGGADPNRPKGDGRGTTPLVLAAAGGHLDCVRKLLARGAATKAIQAAAPTASYESGEEEENDEEDEGEEEDEDAPPLGATAFSVALARGHDDVAALLQLHDEMAAQGAVNEDD